MAEAQNGSRYTLKKDPVDEWRWDIFDWGVRVRHDILALEWAVIQLAEQHPDVDVAFLKANPKGDGDLAIRELQERIQELEEKIESRKTRLEGKSESLKKRPIERAFSFFREGAKV